MILQSFKVQQGNLCQRAVAMLHVQAPANLISAVLQDESCGWKSGGGLPGYAVSSGVMLGVSPGHASDCCLIVFKPVFCVVPRHAAEAIEDGKLIIFFSDTNKSIQLFQVINRLGFVSDRLLAFIQYPFPWKDLQSQWVCIIRCQVWHGFLLWACSKSQNLPSRPGQGDQFGKHEVHHEI